MRYFVVAHKNLLSGKKNAIKGKFLVNKFAFISQEVRF